PLGFRHFSGYPEATFLAWGWRVPFLLGLTLPAVGLWIRHRLAESPVFARLKRRKGEARMPVIEVFRRYMQPMLLATGARLAENGLFYIFTTFSLTYVATQLKLDRNMALHGLLVASACSLFTVPAWGALSDRLGRRPVYLWGAVAGGILAFPLFWLLGSGRSGGPGGPSRRTGRASRTETRRDDARGAPRRPPKPILVVTYAPGGSRTHGLRLRRPTLYPAELLAGYELQVEEVGGGRWRLVEVASYLH